MDTDDVADDLKDFGTKPAIVNAITKALVSVSSGDGRISTRKKGTDISVPDSGEGSGVEKL